MSIVLQLKVKAIGLPNYRLIYTPKCYARITIDDRSIVSTKAVRGTCPEWGECFEISLKDSSTIKVQLFHVRSPSTEVLRGTALIHVRDSLPQANETIRREHKLHQAGVKDGKGGLVVVSLCRKLDEHQSGVAPDSLDSKIPSSASVTAIQKSSHLSKAPELVAEEVLVDVERAEATVAKLKGYSGTPLDNTTAATCSDLCSSILGFIDKVVKFGDVLSQVHPYARLAWNVLTVAHKVLKDQLLRDDKIKMLLLTICDMLEFVEDADAVSKVGKLQDTVSSMMVEIYHGALFIQEYGKHGLGMRVVRSNISTTTDARIEQFIATFNRLKWKFDQGISIQTFNTVHRLTPLLEDIHKTETDKLLERLPGWNLDGVKFNELKTCLGGTRQQLLSDIHAWAHSIDQACILWLSGGAGTGKTSVANSVAVFFDTLGRLGACFCFSRDTAGLNNPNYLFGNLCYQLAHFGMHKQLKSNILSVIDAMGHVAGSSLQTQARRLIVETTSATELVGPVVLVIDALDESGTLQTRKELMDVITAELPKLPRSIKVMITSRDEPDIRASLRDCSREICIDDVEKTLEDIASYIQHRLTTIRQRSCLSERWPGKDKLQELVRRAGHLFIWASVACNFVEDQRDPVRRLNHLLDAMCGVEGAESPLTTLDILYSSILKNAFPDANDPLVDFRYVVGSIITLESPLTCIELDSLLGLGEKSEGNPSILQDGHEVQLSSSYVIISSLQSILRAGSTEPTKKDGLLRLLHPSLYEYLTTRADVHFRIDPWEQNRILALRCLSIMNSQLRFNICEIGDPSLLNKEIEDLPERIDHYMSHGLRYSCHSIGYHITKVQRPDPILQDALKEFILVHLLHWIEMMSLLGGVRRTEGCLHALACWMKDHECHDANIQTLVDDAIAFLRNSGHAIRLSALHTYYSALPLTPKATTLFQQFTHNVPHAPHIVSSHPTWPTTSVRVMEGHTDGVNHVVFSPDGKMLASASYDNTVRLWDVESGQSIGGALEGHTYSVTCVVFSPDGNMLASASYDNTVQLWDIKSGQPREAFRGHTTVRHVVFSSNGKKLVSVSDDSTVQIWDVENGQSIGHAHKGHTHSVTHIALSSDGKKLAWALYDNIMWLWDIESGQAMGEGLKGHTSTILHAVFSPSGDTLASASYDNTVRLWDVKSGQPIGESIKGHTSSVYYVAFSPDGKILVSASDDKTVQLWDVESGQSFGETLKGHTSLVRHVVFSPDGMMLAVASDDSTVQLWNLKTGHALREVLKGHTSSVCRVVFSPDGKKLASASYDSTVRLWEIEGGKAIGEAVKGHTQSVSHVVFSSDRRILASASDDNNMWLWDVESGKPIGEALKGHTSMVRHIVFSPDGKKLASASHSTVQLWDIEGRQAIGEALKGHTRSVTCVVFSPNGEKLASASYDNTVRLWDIESGQSMGGALKGHTSSVHHVLFSPDGNIVASASYDNTVRLWDVKSGQTIGEALEGHTRPVTHVVFSPNGKMLASASYDNTVCLWDVKSGQPIGEALKGHTDCVNHIIFSPDGRRLASVSYDNTIRLWNTESGQSMCQALKIYTDNIYLGRMMQQTPEIDGGQQTKESFINSLKFSSSHDGENLGPDSIDTMVHTTMSFDELGFLRHGTTRLLWLPAMLRGCIAAQSSLIVVGGGSGAMTFIKWPGM